MKNAKRELFRSDAEDICDPEPFCWRSRVFFASTRGDKLLNFRAKNGKMNWIVVIDCVIITVDKHISESYCFS